MKLVLDNGTELDVVNDIKTIKLRKDDVVMIRIKENIGGNYLENIMKELKKVFTDNKVILTADNIEIEIVSKED